MVLQVAGSGGTFPIELLPGFFQKLQPIMPFYPAMNALRETIGGFYGNNYIMYIGALLLHTIIPLLIGLVFRRPIIKFKQELSEKLEETDRCYNAYKRSSEMESGWREHEERAGSSRL